jgi:hypothetical protein
MNIVWGRGRPSAPARTPTALECAALPKGVRLSRSGLPRHLRAPFAAGAVSAFLSTAASLPFLRPLETGASWRPFAAYRLGLAGLTLAREGARTYSGSGEA